MSTAGDSAKLNKLKEKNEELKSLVKDGKSQLGSMESKVAEAKAELDGFKDQIPEIPSVTGKLEALKDAISGSALVTMIAEIKNDFGSAIANFDSLISELNLDSFPPQIDTSKLFEKFPNVEIKADGAVVEEPKESKPAEDAPPAETEANNTTESVKIEIDKEETNKLLAQAAYRKATGAVAKVANQLDLRRKKRQIIYDFTWPELWVELAEKGGSTFDEEKRFDYTQEELKVLQEKYSTQFKVVAWDYKSEGQVWEREYNAIRDAAKADPGPNIYKESDDFATAAAEAVARRKKKLG